MSDEAQKTLEAIIQEALKPLMETLDSATESLTKGQKMILAQGEVINSLTDSLIDIAGFTAQAMKESDDPEVRHTLKLIAQRMTDVIDSVRESL
tara:strand:- start:399 stop:680 length:282 start_codon:yes stop_codon:yes gene_type:complete